MVGREIISSRTGQSVWSCSQYRFNHKTGNARKILKGLLELNEDFDSITRKQLLNLREKIVRVLCKEKEISDILH
ncbi:MAG: hypothetical protein JW891_02605 [Candidatus Lokiarchaeota archaeon]|nr:hypothetical protein [Candidatus Lokiarchaeota archaeon]